MPNDKNEQNETQNDPTPESQDDTEAALLAAGFRKVRGAWRR